eukprot:5056837-Amphidinium_carterae.1
MLVIPSRKAQQSQMNCAAPCMELSTGLQWRRCQWWHEGVVGLSYGRHCEDCQMDHKIMA